MSGLVAAASPIEHELETSELRLLFAASVPERDRVLKLHAQ